MIAHSSYCLNLRKRYSLLQIHIYVKLYFLRNVCNHCFQRLLITMYSPFYNVFMKIVLCQRLLIIKVITSFNCLYLPDL